MICRPPPLLLHLAAPAVNRACSGWHAPPRAFSTVLVRCKGDAQGGHMAAPEMLWLFEGQQQSIDSGDMQPMLDAVWTLQYQIPGAICGFAGEVTTPEGVPDALSAGFTHAVHLRFAQLQGMTAFGSNPRLQQTLEMEANPLCTSVFQLGFEGCTVRDMEAVFRRGPDWEEGQEVLMLMATTDVRAHNGHDQFLQKLAELAELCGSLPVSYGPVCSATWQKGDGHAWHRATHAFMARFRTKHELRQFVASAPVQALQRSSSAGLPFALELLLAFDIEPPKKSKAVPPPKL